MDPENPSWDDERHDRNAQALILGLGAGLIVLAAIVAYAGCAWLLLRIAEKL